MSTKDLSKSLNLQELQNLIKKKSYLISASNKPDLYKLFNSPENILRFMIHYQSAHNGLYKDGHWCGLFINKNKKIANFMDPYGEYPDDALKHIKPGYRFLTEQENRDINRFLDQLVRKGFKVHYNDFPFQKLQGGINTCGRWTGDFLRRGLSTDAYEKFIKNYTRVHNLPTYDDAIVTLTNNYLK